MRRWMGGTTSSLTHTLSLTTTALDHHRTLPRLQRPRYLECDNCSRAQWSWAINNRPYLYMNTYPPSLVGQGVAPPAPPPSGECKYEPDMVGYDLGGHDFGGRPADNAAACAAVCCSLPECVGCVDPQHLFLLRLRLWFESLWAAPKWSSHSNDALTFANARGTTQLHSTQVVIP
jgi:hypothetical protein